MNKLLINSLKLVFVAFLFPITSIAQNPDINILKEINLNRNTSFDGTFRLITNSAAPVAYGVPALLIGVGYITKDSLTFHNGLYIGKSILLSAIVAEILKYSVNRTRPFVTYPFIENVAPGGSPSFPSGHTSDAFSFATSVSIACPKWYIIVPSYTWAGTVAYSRMDLGVHYPSDVLAGAIIGAGSAYLTYKITKWLNRK